MQHQTNESDAEKEILNELLLKEEDVLKKLKDLVTLSKKYFMIEQNTGNVVFSKTTKLSNRDKIQLLLIGRYFASRLKILTKESINIADLSRLLDVPKTTLSAPLGSLVNEGFVNKNSDSEYSIIFHKIEGVLQGIK